MTKKETETVGLHRDQRPRRRRPRWWLIVLIVLALGIVAVVLWLNSRRLSEMFEPQPTLPPTAAAEQGVLYATSFEDESQFGDWEQFDDGFISAAIMDGQLVFDVNALTDNGGWSGLNLTFEDFVLDVDATRLAGPDDNGIIVVFRLTDTDNYNRFDISSNGFYAVSQVREGVATVVSDWNRSAAIQTGDATNHIRVRAQGDSFQFAVNGTVLQLCVNPAPDVQPLWDASTDPPTCLGGEVTDTWVNGDLPQGKIGLGAQGFIGADENQPNSALATIGFDNLAIYPPGGEPAQP
jgi:hypothetical protein